MDFKNDNLIQNSPLPIYFQLAKIIESKIEVGELKEGDRLESEEILAKKFKVGRPTVRQALDYLKSQGLIVKRKGSGSYVSTPKKKEISILELMGITEAFKKEKIQIEKKIIDDLKIIKVLDPLNPFNGKNVYFFSRLDLIEHQPLIFEKFYLEPSLFKGIKNYNFEEVQLSDLSSNVFSFQISQLKQIFKAIFGDNYLKKIFKKTKKFPLLFVKREIQFENKAGVFVEMYIDTEKFDFSQHLFPEVKKI